MPAIPISHVLPRETFAPAWEDSISEFGDRFQPSQMSIRYCLSKKIRSSKNTTRISVCYLYFHRFHACSFPWETSEKHSTILSLGRPVPVQRPFSRDNLLYRVNQCWFVVITWPLKARELKRERQFFFQFSRIFYTSKEKFYIPFYKKKKKKFLRISSINSPFNRCFHAIIHFYHRANQCYHIPLNIRKLMKRIFLLLFFFFFSNFTRVPFPMETLRKSGENFTEFSFIDYYDYFLRRIVDSPFSYPIEYQKIAFDEGKRSRFLATRV